jgi:hypothetical protein
MPRKRFSAFDDFPTGDEKPSQWTPADDEQAETAAERAPETGMHEPRAKLFGGSKVLSEPQAHAVERIERLKPTQMMPDRFQPRRLLPTALRQSFYSGQIDCYQAAHQWLQMARSDSGIKKEVDRLLAMGTSFEEHGQIKPITGSWVETQSGDYIFLIETGERRFWASCLQFAANKEQEEPLLRVEVITNPTRMRQVLENRHAEPPSAVGQACEVASLILAELGVAPQPDVQEEFEYFRQWRARRMPTGMWEKLTPVMQLTRERMVQLLNILELPDPLLDLADRYRLPERVLREVLRAPESQREALLRSSIQNEWTAEDVAINIQVPKTEKKPAAAPDPIQQAMNSFRRFINAVDVLDEDTRAAIFDELANDLVISDRGEAALIVLRELSERLRIRQQNRIRRR